MSYDLVTDPIEVETPAGLFRIHIYPDPDAENPREWDNMGIMVCAHGRYELGDKEHGVDMEDAGSWTDILDRISEQNGDERTIALPMYMLDHSGLALSTEDFGDPWDSGQVGYIYVPLSRIKEFMALGDRDIDEEITSQVLDILKSEVKTYGAYLNGEAVRYEVLNQHDEIVDDCAGFYDLESAEEAARENIPQEEESLEE